MQKVCLCSCMCIGSFMFRKSPKFFLPYYERKICVVQSKGENDSLADLVFFLAKEYICIFYIKQNRIQTLSSDGVNMTSQITACQP